MHMRTRSTPWVWQGTSLAASFVWALPRMWAYSVPGGRDLRLDLLRGFLVVAMVADHLGGHSLLTFVSGHNQFLVSAAEGFVFVSGVVAGIVYGGRVCRLGFAGAAAALLRRAALLHITTAALTLAFIALFCLSDFPLWADRAAGLGLPSPLEAVVGALTLHYTYQGTDVLSIYVLLVATSPVAFYLLSTKRTPLLLAGSWLLWAAYQAFPSQTVMPWPVQNSIFPFAAWQALFITGIALGYHRRQLGWFARLLGRVPVQLALGAAMVGLIDLAQVRFEDRLADLAVPGLNDATFDFLFGKSNLGPGRVLAFAVVATLAQQGLTRLWRPLRAALGWLLLPLGQASLLAYGTHLFLLGPTQALFAPALFGQTSTIWSATVAHAVPLLLILALVKVRAAARQSALSPVGLLHGFSSISTTSPQGWLPTLFGLHTRTAELRCKDE